MPVSGGPSSGTLALMILAGIVSGLPFAIFGFTIGFSMQGLFGASLDSHTGARAVGIYFLAVTLLLLIGLIVVAKTRMNAMLRAFAIAALVTALGLFALCDPIVLLGWR